MSNMPVEVDSPKPSKQMNYPLILIGMLAFIFAPTLVLGLISLIHH